MKFKESELAHKYCKGTGIEIGPAAHNPFNIPGCKNLRPRDREEFWEKSQMDMCGEVSEIDMYGDAENIPVESGSLDYIISSHVIEHVPNPIKAFTEWNRCLKKGGIMFMIFPKRDADAMDVGRELSTLESLISQYKDPQPLTDAERHIWVFDLNSMMDIIDYCNMEKLINWQYVFALETDDKAGNGHECIARKYDE